MRELTADLFVSMDGFASGVKMLPRPIRSCATIFCYTSQLILCLALLAGQPTAARAQENGPIHGLWVWKGPSVLDSSADVESLRDFCRAERINEVYISVPNAAK